MHGNHLDVNYPCYQLLDDEHSVLVIATLAGSTVHSSTTKYRGNSSQAVHHSKYKFAVTSAWWAGSTSTVPTCDHGEDLLIIRFQYTKSVEASEHTEVVRLNSRSGNWTISLGSERLICLGRKLDSRHISARKPDRFRHTFHLSTWTLISKPFSSIDRLDKTFHLLCYSQECTASLSISSLGIKITINQD